MKVRFAFGEQTVYLCAVKKTAGKDNICILWAIRQKFGVRSRLIMGKMLVMITIAMWGKTRTIYDILPFVGTIILLFSLSLTSVMPPYITVMVNTKRTI